MSLQNFGGPIVCFIDQARVVFFFFVGVLVPAKKKGPLIGVINSTAIGLDLWTLTFWIPLIFSFNQQKNKLFAGDLQHPS